MSNALSSPRKDYLNAHPKAKELQDAQVGAICAGAGDYRKKALAIAKQIVDLSKDGRRIGLLVIEFRDSLPGKQITDDFWRQLEDCFVDQHGNPILRGQLEMFERIASKQIDEPFETFMEAFQYQKQLFLASGSEEFFQLEGERGKQVSKGEPNPLSQVKDVFNLLGKSDVFDKLLLNENYCPDGHIRPDLKGPLKVELTLEKRTSARKFLDWLDSELA